MMKRYVESVLSNITAAVAIAVLGPVVTAGFLALKSEATTFKEILRFLLDTDLSANAFLVLSAMVVLIALAIFRAIDRAFFFYDVFISAPMSAFDNEDEYRKFRAICIDIRDEMQRSCGFSKIYYAGDEKRGDAEFSAPLIAARADIAALRRCKRFLVIYNDASVSSCVFEAGMAFERGIKSAYFHVDSQKLPFLMQKLSEQYRHVKTHSFSSYKDMTKSICADGKDLFN